MRVLIVFALLVVAAMAARVSDTKYTSKYDNIDVDQILRSDRILNNYIKCMLDEGPCTPEGKELKKTLPDALKTGCTKCSEKQRVATEKVYRHLTSRRPRDWERLASKFDPQGVYKKKYEETYGKSS